MAFNYGLRPTTVQMLHHQDSSTASAAFGDYTYYVRIVQMLIVILPLVQILLQVQHQIFYQEINQKYLRLILARKIAVFHGSSNVSM